MALPLRLYHFQVDIRGALGCQRYFVLPDELIGSQALHRTVRSETGVIPALIFDRHSSFFQIVKRVLVQAFLTKLAIKTFDEGVLRAKPEESHPTSFALLRMTPLVLVTSYNQCPSKNAEPK